MTLPEMTARQREIAAMNLKCLEHVKSSVDEARGLGLDMEGLAGCMFAEGMQLLIGTLGGEKALDVFRALFKSASRPKRKMIRQ